MDGFREQLRDSTFREGLKERVGGVFGGWVFVEQLERIKSYGNESKNVFSTTEKPIIREENVFQQFSVINILKWICESYEIKSLPPLTLTVSGFPGSRFGGGWKM